MYCKSFSSRLVFMGVTRLLHACMDNTPLLKALWSNTLNRIGCHKRQTIHPAIHTVFIYGRLLRRIFDKKL